MENKSKVYEVVWVDSRFFDGWHSISDTSRMKYSTVSSIGQVVFDDKECIVLALNVGDSSNVSDCIAIAKKSILRKIRR